MPTELEQVGRKGRKLIWQLTVGLSLALVVIAALAISLVASITSNRAAAQSQAICQLVKTIAEAPLTATGKSPTPLGIHLLAGARVAYVRANCDLGPLSPADARIKPYLPSGIK